MNEIDKYYIAQAGSGLSGFRGIRYQRGKGFFGRLLSGAVFPLLKFLGKNLLKTGSNIASDLLDQDDFSMKNVKDVSKKRFKESAGDILGEAAKKMTGSGKKRKKRLKKTTLKRRKRVKRKTKHYKKKTKFEF